MDRDSLPLAPWLLLFTAAFVRLNPMQNACAAATDCLNRSPGLFLSFFFHPWWAIALACG
jgi:hypothetical protein